MFISIFTSLITISFISVNTLCNSSNFLYLIIILNLYLFFNFTIADTLGPRTTYWSLKLLSKYFLILFAAVPAFSKVLDIVVIVQM